jgi:hypothetical protein
LWLLRLACHLGLNLLLRLLSRLQLGLHVLDLAVVLDLVLLVLLVLLNLLVLGRGQLVHVLHLLHLQMWLALLCHLESLVLNP